MLRFKQFLFLFIFTSLTSNVFALIPYKNFTEDLLFVKLRPNARIPHSKDILRVKHLFGSLYAVYTDNFYQLEKELKQSEAFVYVERNGIAKPRPLPKIESVNSEQVESPLATPFNDPRVHRIWSFKDASHYGVSVSQAYTDIADDTPREEVVVAVVDTGVDYRHEDLKDVMWTNPGEIPGNGLDDDNNGYVDDIHGINTLARGADGKASGEMMDGHSHGTHVSGTIAAKQNNRVGIAGIASKVRIMGIRTVPNRGDETDVNVVESYLYAAKNGAKLINCSFGKDHNEGGLVVKETIDHIGEKYGVLVIASAGNNSSNIDAQPKYPASFSSENLLVIASTNRYGKLSYFSNYGMKNVDVAAPGSAIYSTVPNNRYANMSGTSMAAPTTTGVAAEVLSQFPNLSGLQLKKVLIESVTLLPSYKNHMLSGGRIDLVRALEAASKI